MSVYFNFLNSNESLFYTLIKNYNTTLDQNHAKNKY